jgi:hypothetical protein
MTDNAPKKSTFNPVNFLIVAVTLAILALSTATIYSAYVAHANHSNNCTSRNLTAQSIEDVISAALAPPPGQTLTATQFKAAQSFQASADARIDQIRC